MKILRLGSSGQEVRKLQDVLNLVRATQPSLKCDGIFGPSTQAAVRSFQQRARITVDGVVGPVTTTALLKAMCGLDARR
jgi:peptidoglycan hydrolase-like protein with peptidoglycan-binding domain